MPIHLVELVKPPRIEQSLTGGHTRRFIVGLDDGVIARIELEGDDIPGGGDDGVRVELMGIFSCADLDDVRFFAPGGDGRFCCVSGRA